MVLGACPQRRLQGPVFPGFLLGDVVLPSPLYFCQLPWPPRQSQQMPVP